MAHWRPSVAIPSPPDPVVRFIRRPFGSDAYIDFCLCRILAGSAIGREEHSFIEEMCEREREGEEQEEVEECGGQSVEGREPG